MHNDILATKLHLPLPRAAYVARPRLLRQLDHVQEHKLTLVTAPAGFGKTSLLREWIQHSGMPVGWLSLDEGDDHLPRLLLYLIHAFRQNDPSVGHEALALLDAGGMPYATTVLTQLTNDLAATDALHIVILDDYHMLSEQAIHDTINFLITHLPANAHLILSSRTQPQLSLSRLRGQAQLLEINATDLRFTAVEVEQFFELVMKLDLSAGDRTSLEMRTEGWVAGLQLAGLSLQTRTDPSAFIASFSGSDRLVADYLFEEVLQHQTDELQEFLLATSLLDHLCAELCDAVLDDKGSQSTLELLDSRHLFIVPLDSERRWFRYHHLFAELLRYQMHRTQPNQIPQIYQRASQWYEQQDRHEEAIRYASKAEDWERTADLLEATLHEGDWVQSGMHHLLAGFEAVPGAVLRARPALELAYAWLLFEIFSDEWKRIETHLHHVEAALTASEVGLPPDENQTMRASVDLLRANRARQSNQPERVIELCRQALERLPDEEMYTRSGATVHLAAGYESASRLLEAGQMYEEGITMCRTANNVNGLMFASARYIEVLRVAGQLRRAESVFTRASEAVGERTGPDVGMLYVTIGEVYREQNRLDVAEDMLRRGVRLCSPFDAWKAGTIAGSVSLARTLAAQGHFEEAFQTLDELKQSSHIVLAERTQLDAASARLDLKQGLVHSAVRWAEGSSLSAETEIDYSHEFEGLTLARVWIARGAAQAQGVQLGSDSDPLQKADHLLNRLQKVAQSGGRMGSVIEIGLLQTLVLALRHETDEALHSLREALRFGEPEGYLRLFADEGALLIPLLRMLLANPAHSASRAYIEMLLEATSDLDDSEASLLPGTKLTERELRALHLLATDASTDEIADIMSVSVSTVRTYAKRIYGKLGVHSRAEAVYLARELKLL